LPSSTAIPPFVVLKVPSPYKTGNTAETLQLFSTSFNKKSARATITRAFSIWRETQTGEFLVGAVSPIEHTAMNPQLLFIASARMLAFGYDLIILERYVKTMYEFQTN
jgi:hypothetical protein